jgi:hypothetical protein
LALLLRVRLPEVDAPRLFNGDLYRVPVIFHKSEWRINTNGLNVEKIKEHSQGMIYTLKVQKTLEKKFIEYAQFRLSDEKGNALKEDSYQDEVWFPNISACFPKPDKRKGLTLSRLAYQSDSQWLPIDRSFPELFYDRWTNPDDIWLYFIDAEEFGGKLHYRFSVREGENYLVPADVFVDEDLTLLKEELEILNENYSSLGGLLVRGKATLNHGKLNLTIRKTGDGDNQQLMVDKRNLQWKDLFTPGTIHTMNRNRGDWHVPYPAGKGQIPGFNVFSRYISVDIPSPPRSGAAEVSIESWSSNNWRTGVIKGRQIQAD